MSRKIGLYFGSFNPIHSGHLIIAQAMLNYSDFSEIWFVVSPQNPLKSNAELADETHRLQMVSLAIADNDRFRLCDAEFSLPKPSYTIHTLDFLKKEYPEYEFGIVMGADNLNSLNQWKSYKEIIDNYSIYVYPRTGYAAENNAFGKQIRCAEFPYLDISSTYVRTQLREEKSIRYLVHDKVLRYIAENELYC